MEELLEVMQEMLEEIKDMNSKIDDISMTLEDIKDTCSVEHDNSDVLGGMSELVGYIKGRGENGNTLADICTQLKGIRGDRMYNSISDVCFLLNYK